MASTTPRTITPTNHIDAGMHNPAEAKLKSASPPRTPRRRRDPPSSYPKSARLAAATGAPLPDDLDKDSTTDDDAEDPHDLTYRPKHFPRASMVDNMAMALDQLSNPTIESIYREDDSKSYRIRGHTASSSVSSDSDIRSLQSRSPQSQNHRLARGGSARQVRDFNRLSSIFGEDEDNTRARVYDRQNAAQNSRPRKSAVDIDHHKGSDSISSVDLSHLHRLQGRLGPAGNRRSQSFDFGTRRVIDEDPNQSNSTAMPKTRSGTDPHDVPTSPNLQPATLGRRNSTKSAKNTRNKSSTLGTSAVHGTAAPQIPPLVPTPADKRSTIIQTVEQTPTSRPGIFRRFFTSSRSMQNLAASSSPAVRPSIDQTPAPKDAALTALPQPTKLYKHSHKGSIEATNKENQPPQTIQKKPSSFFRRRKKSTNTIAVPPLPLTLNTVAPNEVKPGQSSPVSSLKAFMDPYLNGEQSQTEQPSMTSPLHTFYTASQNSAGTGITNTDSSESSKPVNKPSERLSIPQKETFLTDNSSAEDVPTDTDRDIEEAEQAKTPSQWPPIAPRTSSASTPRAITNPSIPTIRPVVEARSTSWHSERRSIPPRKQSLSTLDNVRMTGSSPPDEVVQPQRNLSGSDVSDYRSAPSTPAVNQNIVDPLVTISPRFHISHPSIGQGPSPMETEKAQKIYDNSEEEFEGRTAAVWLGEAGSDRERIRKEYFNLYDFTSHNILAALRSLCSRLVLKAESQLIDRILDAFAKRWCECNPNHGFKSTDIVHTICYSLLLLNTDLHMADIGSKMTRTQFIRNAMQTIREVIADTGETNTLKLPQHQAVRSSSTVDLESDQISLDRSVRATSSLGHRPSERLIRSESNEGDINAVSGPLVDVAFSGSQGGWELEIEGVLKSFYFSISKEPLPLFRAEPVRRFPPVASNHNLLSLNSLRRTPSVLSKTQSESSRSRYGGEIRSLGSKWNGKARSRQRLGSTPGFGSSKNSLDDQSSAWSPSMSSTWSKASLGKTLTSMSVDSFATSTIVSNDYQSSIGFANALSQAIIREDQIDTQTEDGTSKAVPLLEDESLELEGAPWAKEGILKHKCHLDGVDKRSKDRNWNDCFAVIEKGWMRLFSFTMTAKSLRHKARTQKPGGVVGGGNWQDNAEEVWKFMLRHTIASSLPPPGYSKTRPHVWALSLPTGAVHLFSVGTPDIVKEFVSTANFWSARLSKEPMIGGISSMEYGWSDTVLERAGGFINVGSEGGVRSSVTSSSKEIPRPSTQISMRSSLDHTGGYRPKLPGDRIHISDWSPPQQSLLASQLLDVDQIKALQNYVAHVEEDLQRHNELRAPMLLAFSSKNPNYNRAMSNWEKKSSYLLREIVKFKNYIDALQSAQQAKERIYRMRHQEQQQRMDDDDSFALHASASLSSNGF